MAQIDFEQTFKALTGHGPYPWQRRLYERMLAGDWPPVCDIPTGLGKTSAVICWLIALAHAEPNAIPRRLVYVVNRRTIVDQVTEVAERLWEKLIDSQLKHLRQALAKGVANREGDLAGDALTISTLRGEFADNGAWRADPARAAIIVGTPDLIGSDLLFSGYRTGKRSLAHHAGLLGHDALIVHDEAHLSSAMQTLLERIAEMQTEAKSARPVRVMALSATGRDAGDRPPLTLDDMDHHEPAVQQRLDAHKRLRIEVMEAEENEKAPAFRNRWLGAIAERAWNAYHEAAVRVVVYVRLPDHAKAVHDNLAKRLKKADKKTAEDRIALLTGRLRGAERDRLADGSVLTALREAAPVDETIYLVATSAGEVGADLDADHLVCDLTTADALVQRLGRVNRRGERTADDGCNIDLIAGPEPEPKPDAAAHSRWQARQATLALLQSLPTGDDGRIDASPRATRAKWNIPDDCREPAPETMPLTEPMVSALSMTSVERTRLVTVRVNGREEKRRVPTWPLLPDVATLIHGLVEETAEVTLSWRAEVPYLADSSRPSEEVDRLSRQVLKACPIRSAERLTLPAHDAADWLGERCKKLHSESHVGLLVGRGVQRLRLDDNVTAGDLVGRTLLLPPAFGGLDRSGMPDAASKTPSRRLDLGDRERSPHQAGIQRHLLRAAGDGFETRPLTATGDDWQPIELTVHREAVERIRELETNREKLKSFTRRVVLPLCDADDKKPRLDLVVFRTPADRVDGAAERVPLHDHNEQVTNRALRFAKALGLQSEWGQALENAARRHDTGKSRYLWQAFAGNRKLEDLVAKPVGRGQPDWTLLDGYRHEYGSLLDAVHAGIDDPLTLHLIASHHPAARPHFQKLFDPEHRGDPPDAASALAIALRFDALQKEHGQWGLAWLEALLRSADRTVSAGDAADDFDAQEDADA